MFVSPNQSRRATVARVLVALIGATGALAAVAYATSAPPSPDDAGDRARMAEAGAALSTTRARPVAVPSRPRITRYPAKSTLSTWVSFRYAHRQAGVDFQCKLDAAGWKRCGRTRVAYRGLAVGPHRFLVRAEVDGARSRPARYAWTQAQPKGFSIEPELSALARLFPGATPVAVPVVLTNPNSAPIRVTALKVAVAADPAGCPSAENLELIQSSASESKPVNIPAGGSVRLPAPGVSAPSIALRNLPANQDACQGAQFPLAFSGDAQG